jgi:uncharacterized protein with HEPN domain
MSENDRIRLLHIVDAAKESIEFVRDRQRRDLETDRMLTLALVKEIEIVGEAADHLSPEFLAAAPQIPWSKAIGMRHRLVHAYFDIDFDLLWTTVVTALPPLILEIERLLSEG